MLLVPVVFRNSVVALFVHCRRARVAGSDYAFRDCIAAVLMGNNLDCHDDDNC